MGTLKELLPQAEPMVLLSGYVPDSPQGTVSAYAEISESSPFYEIESAGVPSDLSLAHMAQALALAVGGGGEGGGEGDGMVDKGECGGEVAWWCGGGGWGAPLPMLV